MEIGSWLGGETCCHCFYCLELNLFCFKVV